MANANPFDALATQTSKNPFDALASTSASENPFDRLAGIAGVKYGAAKVAANVGDALDWQRAKSQEAIFHRGSSDANREALRTATGLKRSYDDPRLFGSGPGTFGIPVPGWATHLGRGLTDTVLDTEVDPLTYEGGAIGKLAKGAIGLAGKGIGAAEKLPFVGDKIANVAQGATDAGNAIHDYFTHAGAATRTEGKPAVDFALGAKTKTASHETELDARLQQKFEAIRAGLSDEDFATALQVQKGERQAFTAEGRPLVSSEAAGAAAALKHLFRQAYALRADAGGQARIADYGVGQQAMREDPNLFRYQQNAGDPEVSSLRSGTFFGPSAEWVKPYKGKSGAGLQPVDREGGQHLVERVANARNPFNTPSDFPEGPAGSLVRRGLPVPKNPQNMEGQQAQTLARRALLAMGVPADEAAMLTRRMTPATYDRLAAEYLRRKGHDAIVNPHSGEFFALTPEATRPAVLEGAKRVTAAVAPKVNAVEATRDIEANNAARGRIVRAFAKEALPTIEQHPDYIAAAKSLPEYRVGGKGMTAAQIADNLMRIKESLATRVGQDRFRAMPPAEQQDLMMNFGGTRREMSTGGDRYVSNRGGAAAGDPLSQILVDAQRPIIDKSKRSFTVTSRVPTTPYQLDADIAEFGGQPGTLGWQQNRRNYVPGPREAKAVDPNKPAQTYSLLDKFDPNAEQQGPFAIDPANTAPIADATRAMLKNTAAQVGRSELRKELEAQFGKSVPGAIKDLFDITTPATGTARSAGQKAAENWKSFVDLPKRAVVGVLPRHMVNVASLAALNDPRAAARAIAQVPRVMKGGAERYNALKPGIEAGAIGPRRAHDLDAPQWLAQLGLDKFAPVRAIGGLANKYGSAIDNATWSMDESAVNELAKARGGGYGAGRDARKALVDYDNASRFTQHARAVAPFATFETGIPGAVAKAIARNPGGVEAANRLTGGTLLGGETDVGGHKVSLNLPTAKVGRLLGSGDALDYVRGATADPIHLALSFVLGRTPNLSPKDKQYMTYGLDPYKPDELRKIVENMALGGIPEARDILRLMGEGSFKSKPAAPQTNWLESLLGTLGQSATGVRVK